MTPAHDFSPVGACVLTNHALLLVGGDDAATFLHGQLSNDVTHLGASTARLAAYCDAKGRMLASFVYARTSAGRIALVCRADLAESTVKRLRMFVMRAKVQIEDGAAAWRCVGLAGDAAAASVSAQAGALAVWGKLDLPEESLLVRLPDAAGVSRWLWLGPTDASETWIANLPVLRAQDWSWLEVQSGIAQVSAATAGAFVPQMLNYELVGGVDFKKGCYPGQEVVARSHYLGKLKRRSVLVTSGTPLQAGQAVFWSTEPHQPAGLVALSAEAPDGTHAALVELKISALESGSLHAGTADGPALSVGPLPYALPHEATPT